MEGRGKLLALLVVCCLSQQIYSQCDLKTNAESKDFPDLFQETYLSYQMTVEYTAKTAAQSDYAKEYYDVQNTRGRVDMHVNGTSYNYYYFKESNEAFEVSGGVCKSLFLNETSPKFMGDGQNEWIYPGKKEVRGPSAMFRYALDTWKNKRNTMAYMGESDRTIRGIPAQKWRRCKDDLVIDYYFTMESHTGEFNLPNLVLEPLRVEINRTNDKSGFYPQIYDILVLQPFISDEEKMIQVPTGKGCIRGDGIFKPPMKKYLESTIYTRVESICMNCDGKQKKDDTGLWNYYSTFTFAADQQSSQFAYIYTPWGEIDKDGRQLPGGLKHVFYDEKNNYLYTHDLLTDKCEITRQPSFSPRYYFPKGGGYIDLTDDFILYPDQEYSYLDDGVYKGMPVHIYEAVVEGYVLGNRTIGRAVFTRYYFRDAATDNENIVPGSLSAIKMVFYPDKKDLTYGILLTFNFFAFSTQIPYRRSLFRIADCFKNTDDSSWITFSFPADPATLDKLRDEGPNIELEVFDSLIQNSELSALRVPTMLLDISNAVYVTLQILEKPPIELDFKGEEKDMTITGTQRIEGVSNMQSCGKICVESEASCWGIAIRDGLCYLGVDDKAKVVAAKNWTLYRRYSNTTFMPSKEKLLNSIRKEVESNRIRIVIPPKNSIEQMIQLEANFMDISVPSDPDNSFNRLGKKTDPRFRIFKAGAKLVKTGETIKNLGNLGYEECQRICLDYKRCETVSYCANGPQCIITTTSADDLSADHYASDGFCNLLSRKYADHFINAPGTFLTKSYRKSLKAASAEECAKLCLKESSFTCFSFDFCPWDTSVTCLLHDVHILDLNKQESMKTNATCGHFYKKFSYDFTRKPQQRSVGSALVPISKLNLESCAKTCVELKTGTCLGYDFCQDQKYTSTSCIIFTDKKVADSTTHSDICDHYTKLVLTEKGDSPKSTVVVGVVCFFVAAVVGIILTFGIAYLKVRRSR